MSATYHKLLVRQLRRALGADPTLPPALAPLLQAVSQAYDDADAERSLIERALALMSSELNERNAQLGEQLQSRQQSRDELQRKNEEQEALIKRLEDAHNQLLQSEKLASIGQLAAGVAHEINNPVGYVFSNFGTLERYLSDMFRMLAAYEAAEPLWAGSPTAATLAALRTEIELDYLKEDVPALMAESLEGITRVRKIVQDLKDFSHVDARQEWEWADLHKGLDSTLNIVNNEIKYKANVVRQYGQLPEVHCLPTELNQVFMNLLVNAAHAMPKERGTITIRTGMDGDQVCVEIEDDGCGIPKDAVGRIFDPFFTTKPIGKGTGLGLSLSYGIVHKHAGRLEVRSEPGVGTTFKIVLPVDQARTQTLPVPPGAAAASPR
jgi:two-component system, NtrC family, sensor kinase